MKKIYISPSDQTENRYAVGNTNEAAQCRKIASALAEDLVRCGFQVRANLTDEMEERVAESNAWSADLHLCIHTNAYDGTVMGTRMFAVDTEGEGYQICKALMARLAPITPGESDNIKAWPGLYEVRNTAAPTAYVEVGFHDNAVEAQWILDHTDQIAESLCKGLCDYYGVIWTADTPGVYNTLEQVPLYARNTIQKLMQKDFLVGTTAGLELTLEMIRLLVINDRAGLYD